MKLLDEGNLKRYLIYAIGEILLVMVGILLALQVNNWNQERDSKKSELKALIDLSEEFKTNKQRIIDKDNLRTTYKAALDNYLNLVSQGSVAYKDYIHLSEIRSGGGITNPSRGVLNTLMSSGDLKYITNDSLKYLLADWNDQLVDLTENEQILWNHVQQLNEYRRTHIPHRWYEWPGWTEEKKALNFSNVKVDFVYWNTLIYVKGNLEGTSLLTENILENLDQIVRIINQEIQTKE